MKNLLIGFIAGIAAIIGIALIAGLSGAVNVAATEQDPAPLAWFLHTSFERSVATRSADITPPADLDGPERVERGARSFAAMCAGCHTPPGLDDTPRAIGLNPAPPALAALSGHRSDAEAFWVIRNGARMTGMPAFGPTHQDPELWDLVAFLRTAEDLSPERYAALSAGPVDDGHDHRHGDADAHGSMAAAVPEPVPASTGLPGPDASPADIVDAYHAALRRGDEAAVLALLVEDVRIFESGRVERSRADYRSHHLPADLKAAAGVSHKPLERTVSEAGDTAWVLTRTHVTGTVGESSVNLGGTETMGLRRTADGWRIAHIHWSFGEAPKTAPAGHEGHDHAH